MDFTKKWQQSCCVAETGLDYNFKLNSESWGALNCSVKTIQTLTCPPLVNNQTETHTTKHSLVFQLLTVRCSRTLQQTHVRESLNEAECNYFTAAGQTAVSLLTSWFYLQMFRKTLCRFISHSLPAWISSERHHVDSNALHKFALHWTAYESGGDESE